MFSSIFYSCLGIRTHNEECDWFFARQKYFYSNTSIISKIIYVHKCIRPVHCNHYLHCALSVLFANRNRKHRISARQSDLQSFAYASLSLRCDLRIRSTIISMVYSAMGIHINIYIYINIGHRDGQMTCNILFKLLLLLLLYYLLRENIAL